MRTFVFFRPVEFIAKFFITKAANRFALVGLPTNLTNVFLLIFKLTFDLIPRLGFLPTLRVLFRLRNLIRYNLPVSQLNNINTFLPLNTHVVEEVLNIITPSTWRTIISKAKAFLFIYNFVLLPFLSLTSILPLIRVVFKGFFGVFLSSLGIVWSVGDTSITSLKWIAEPIIEFIESKLSLDIPRETLPRPGISVEQVEGLNDNTASRYATQVDHKTTSWFTILGILVLGVVTSITVLLVGEHYYPETVHSIPIINTLTDCLHITYNSVYNALFSVSVTPDPGNNSTMLPFPQAEPLSSPTQSSGGSDITITDARTVNANTAY